MAIESILKCFWIFLSDRDTIVVPQSLLTILCQAADDRIFNSIVNNDNYSYFAQRPSFLQPERENRYSMRALAHRVYLISNFHFKQCFVNNISSVLA